MLSNQGKYGLALLVCCFNLAHADVLITVKQDDFDVVAEVSGELDLSNEPSPDTYSAGDESVEGLLSPASDCVSLGNSKGAELTGLVSSNFPVVPNKLFTSINGASTEAVFSEGDYISVCGPRAGGGRLVVETGFTGPISGSSRWENTNYQRLSLPAPGSFVWQTDGGEKITLVIEEQAPIPRVDSVLNINIRQVGSDVVATVSGELDLRGETSKEFNPGLIRRPSVRPSFNGYLSFGQRSFFSARSLRFPLPFESEPQTELFTGLETTINASESLGAFFSMELSEFGNDSFLYPDGFVSGPLDSETVWTDFTIQELGLRSGSYTWKTFGGATINVIIGKSPLPAASQPIPSLSGPILIAFCLLLMLGAAVRLGRHGHRV